MRVDIHWIFHYIFSYMFTICFQIAQQFVTGTVPSVRHRCTFFTPKGCVLVPQSNNMYPWGASVWSNELLNKEQHVKQTVRRKLLTGPPGVWPRGAVLCQQHTRVTHIQRYTQRDSCISVNNCCWGNNSTISVRFTARPTALAWTSALRVTMTVLRLSSKANYKLLSHKTANTG